MDYADLLTQENDRLAALVADTDLEAGVPTCPGWSVRQVLKHVGRGHRWAAQMVEERSSGPLDPGQVPGGRPPDDPAGTADWLRASGAKLLSEVAAAGDAEVWTFTGPRPASWWVRRRLHEVTVHRADVALASGTAYEIAPELAADGVDEWLGLITVRGLSGDAAPLPPGSTLGLTARDADASWLLGPGSAGPEARIEAPAADLLLALTRRGDDVMVSGDAAVWERWLAKTPF